MHRRSLTFALAVLTAAAFGCQEATTAVPRDESDGQQLRTQLGPNFSTSPGSTSTGGMLRADITAAVTYRIVGVGANFGNADASQICSSGDVTCTYTQISEATFNGMTVAALRAAYDVLIFTWISLPALNADWNTRLLPYMALGGGIVFEDPGNLGDLAPGVTAFTFEANGAIVVSAVVPGLTDGIVNSFANNHIGFSAWDPALSPFLTHSSATIVGLSGRFGSGCIVLTGPDQHFHGLRGAANPEGNQYNLLLNEVKYVLGLAGTCRNQPPTANAGPDQTVECTGATTLVQLDGTATDPDNNIVSTVWTEGTTVIATTIDPQVALPFGSHTLTLTVTDAAGAVATDNVIIDIVDTTAPAVALAPTPNTLWPPNHKYVAIDLGLTFSDICDNTSALTVSATAVSSEPDDANGNGDGNTTGDVKAGAAMSSNASPIVTFNPLTDQLELRAERGGNTGPRTYTITVTVTDSHGNIGTATATVTVPHNK